MNCWVSLYAGLCVVTLCLYSVAARDAETRRARQQQQANATAAAEPALKAQHEETTRRAGEFEGGSRTRNYLSCTRILIVGFRCTPVCVSLCR